MIGFIISLFLLPPLQSSISLTKDKEKFINSIAIFEQKKSELGIDKPEPVKISLFGEAKTIVILVDFPDKVYQKPRTDFENLLFGATQGTMNHYYNEVSYGQFNVTGEVSNWVRAPNNYSYYCNKNSSPYGFGDYPQNVLGLVEDAVSLADPLIDFSQYDIDGDGYVDGLFVVHSGPGAEATGDSNDIWSHKWSFSDAHQSDANVPEYLFVDNVKIDVYSMEPEILPDNSLITFGVFAHEFAHVLGLPDLYDTDYSSFGIGDFCLMASGAWLGPSNRPGSSPSHISIWGKILLGWLSPQIVSREGIKKIDNANIQDIETNPSGFQLVENPEGSSDWLQKEGIGEYFLIENRQQKGYDIYLPGSGILIFHIDEKMQTNSDDAHPLVGIMQADKDPSPLLSNKGEAKDFWKASDTGFTPTTVPSSSFYSGVQSGASVTKISASQDVMTANLEIGLILLSKVNAYPNPFIYTDAGEPMKITYIPSDPKEAQGKYPFFKVRIFNLTGRLVRTLDIEGKEIDRFLRTAFFDAKNESGNPLGSGLYYYILEIPEKKERNKGKFTIVK